MTLMNKLIVLQKLIENSLIDNSLLLFMQAGTLR